MKMPPAFSSFMLVALKGIMLFFIKPISANGRVFSFLIPGLIESSSTERYDEATIVFPLFGKSERSGEEVASPVKSRGMLPEPGHHEEGQRTIPPSQFSLSQEYIHDGTFPMHAEHSARQAE